MRMSRKETMQRANSMSKKDMKVKNPGKLMARFVKYEIGRAHV